MNQTTGDPHSQYLEGDQALNLYKAKGGSGEHFNPDLNPAKKARMNTSKQIQDVNEPVTAEKVDDSAKNEEYELTLPVCRLSWEDFQFSEYKILGILFSKN